MEHSTGKQVVQPLPVQIRMECWHPTDALSSVALDLEYKGEAASLSTIYCAPRLDRY